MWVKKAISSKDVFFSCKWLHFFEWWWNNWILKLNQQDISQSFANILQRRIQIPLRCASCKNILLFRFAQIVSKMLGFFWSTFGTFSTNKSDLHKSCRTFKKKFIFLMIWNVTEDPPKVAFTGINLEYIVICTERVDKNRIKLKTVLGE